MQFSSFCDWSQEEMDLFRQMMKLEKQFTVASNDKHYLVTFMTTEMWYRYACSSPRNQGGAFNSGYFMESCSEALILYRVEVVVADNIQKLSSIDASEIRTSRRLRTDLLAGCCALYHSEKYRSESKGGNVVSTDKIPVCPLSEEHLPG